MKAMTVTEFWQRVNNHMKHHTEYRKGQSVFTIAVFGGDTALSDWASDLVASELDPYFHDSRVDAFIAAAVLAGHLSEP